MLAPFHYVNVILESHLICCFVCVVSVGWNRLRCCFGCVCSHRLEELMTIIMWWTGWQHVIFARIEMLAHPSSLMQTARDPELSHVRFALNHPDTHTLASTTLHGCWTTHCIIRLWSAWAGCKLGDNPVVCCWAVIKALLCTCAPEPYQGAEKRIDSISICTSD